jgi:hypothetical protein
MSVCFQERDRLCDTLCRWNGVVFFFDVENGIVCESENCCRLLRFTVGWALVKLNQVPTPNFVGA